MMRSTGKCGALILVIAMGPASGCGQNGGKGGGSFNNGNGAGTGGAGAPASGGQGGEAPAGGVPASGGGGGAGGAELAPPVPFTVTAALRFAHGYLDQYADEYRAAFTAGAESARGKVWARFCADAACQQPIALLSATSPEADASGTISLSPSAPTPVSARGEVPPGSRFVQWLLDPEYGELVGLPPCAATALDACPGDGDVLMTAASAITNTGAGAADNPPASSQAVTVAENGTFDFADEVTLGSVFFATAALHARPPAESGAVVIALEQELEGKRWINSMQLFGLDTLTRRSTSYTLLRKGFAYRGNVCGFVRGGNRLLAIGVTEGMGAHVFELDGRTGLQKGTDAVAFLPHPQHTGLDAAGPLPTVTNEQAYPRPCRGVHWWDTNDLEHLFLVQLHGAGSETGSTPAPAYRVDLTALGTTESLFPTGLTRAWRAVATTADRAYFLEPSWSQGNPDRRNRICALTLDPKTGKSSGSPTCTATTRTSDTTCWGAPLPGDLLRIELRGQPKLALAHDTGVAIYDLPALTLAHDVDLSAFGRNFGHLALAPDGRRLYAIPHCRTESGTASFPIGGTPDRTSRYLAAVLDLTGDYVFVATTTIDLDGDGTPENGIDLGYYALDARVRAFGPTLEIAETDYAAPRATATAGLLFVSGQSIAGATPHRGASGMGHAADVGVFSLGSGRGFVFRDYLPFFDGLDRSSTGVWGLPLGTDVEPRVGGIAYLPPGP